MKRLRRYLYTDESETETEIEPEPLWIVQMNIPLASPQPRVYRG